MNMTKLATIATLSLLTVACAGPVCKTRSPKCQCNKPTINRVQPEAKQVAPMTKAEKAAVEKLNFETAPIFFAFNSKDLTPAGEKYLATRADYLKAHAGRTADIRGYTDNVGSAAYNKRLSQQRANAVKAFFVKKGVAADRLTATGYGMTDFVTENDTAAGRAKNRRVEITIK